MANLLSTVNKIASTIDSLLNGIREASFRGVPFGVLDASDSRGRNVVIHEFPQKDQIYVEDMGRAQRKISLTAFQVGPDYASKRDALIAALEEPGPGTLVHPWLGSFYVNLISQATITHSGGTVGYCEFKLEFVEADEAPLYPSLSLFWPDLAFAEGLLARAATALEFAADFILRPVAALALEVAHVWASGLSAILTPIYALADFVFPVIADTVSLFFDQAIKVGSIAALMEGFWPQRDYRRGDGPRAAYPESVALLELSLSSPPLEISPILGTVRRQIANNQAAIANFQREICGIAGLEAAAWASPPSKAEATKLRTLVQDASDFIQENATSERVFRSVQKLTVMAQRALADAAKRAPDVITIESPLVSPLFSVAWRRLLVDSTKTDIIPTVEDLIKRNGVRHPGFTPAGELEALSG
jgi:hypothetical protein